MGALREQMDKDMVLRGMSPRTRESYLYAVRGLAKHYHKSPDALSEQDIQNYLLYLIEERKLAWSSCNIVVQGLKFFYHTTLRRDRMTFIIPRRHAPSKLPEMLSREEILALFDAAPTAKHRLLMMTAYAAGLRVSELVHLKITDIDSNRMTIRVEQGKGAKDRYTVLSEQLLVELRKYWKREKSTQWLFPATRNPVMPMAAETAQKAFYRCKQRAGITKRCGIHGLAPCVCHAPAGRGNGSPSNPTLARSWSAVDDDAVLPSGAERPDADPIPAGDVGRPRSDPPLSAPASCQPAVLTAARRLHAWNWRRYCAPMVMLIGNRTRRPRCNSARCGPSRRAAPQRWAGMSTPVRCVRGASLPLPLLPQPPLPEVPDAGQGTLARRPAR